jgi:protein phosphatase
VPPFLPDVADLDWLAATLHDKDTSTRAAPQTTGHPASGAEENHMSEQPTTTPTLFGGRYEIVKEADDGMVEVLDRAPWLRCWACGSTANEAGELFCTDCGASLDQRRYQGQFAPAEAPTGLALVANITDEPSRALLPELWDVVEEDGRRLVLLASGLTPVAPPLDELAALRVGLALAQLQAQLHGQGMALGNLAPADLHLTPEGLPRLLAVPGLRRIEAKGQGKAASADLNALASLLEALTDTPRTTRRLAEDSVPEAETEEPPVLASLLRQVRTGAIANHNELITQLSTLIAERTSPLPLRHQMGACSDVGMVRDHNEDSLLTFTMNLDNYSQRRVLGCYMVSDGMGGHAAGEVASRLALRGAADLILSEFTEGALDPTAPYDNQQVREIAQRAVLQANEYVVREARARGNDMGATLTLALVLGDRLTVANVGDSRTYLLREGKLRRISKDHSLVMRLVELGQITDDDVYSHPQRNAVLRSLGDRPNVEVDVFSERLRPGDAVLLCSDGQWEMTRDPQMEQILAANSEPDAACQALVKAANEAGGEDNVTAVVVQFS